MAFRGASVKSKAHLPYSPLKREAQGCSCGQKRMAAIECFPLSMREKGYRGGIPPVGGSRKLCRVLTGQGIPGFWGGGEKRCRVALW